MIVPSGCSLRLHFRRPVRMVGSVAGVLCMLRILDSDPCGGGLLISKRCRGKPGREGFASEEKIERSSCSGLETTSNENNSHLLSCMDPQIASPVKHFYRKLMTPGCQESVESVSDCKCGGDACCAAITCIRLLQFLPLELDSALGLRSPGAFFAPYFHAFQRAVTTTSSASRCCCAPSKFTVLS